MGRCLVIAVALAAGTAFGAVTLTEGSAKLRVPPFPRSASGIAYAGGDTYYVVADSNGKASPEVGLYKVNVRLAADGTSVSNVTVGARVKLAGATDLEAVAYDPASGHVWAANETTHKTICEYDPATGARLSALAISDVLLRDRDNFGFESLAISPDGLTMWTANEESLTADGPRSSFAAASTNRLVKFVRAASGKPWRIAAMYPYVTDRWHNRHGLGSLGRRGISDLCALPDGSLLVLERELSSTAPGSDFGAQVNANFYIAIYRITPKALAAATDVKDMVALGGGGWKAVAKGESLVPAEARGFENWEGLCLGPRLPDGRRVVLMLTDAGDGRSLPLLLPLVLTGLAESGSGD